MIKQARCGEKTREDRPRPTTHMSRGGKFRAHTPADASSCGVAGLSPNPLTRRGNGEKLGDGSEAESSLRAACPCGFNPASHCSTAAFLPCDAAPPSKTKGRDKHRDAAQPMWTVCVGLFHWIWGTFGPDVNKNKMDFIFLGQSACGKPEPRK